MREFTDEDKNLIDSVFKGDAKRYRESLEESHRETISWSDLALNAKTLPQHELTAQMLIRELLGYLPDDHLIIRHEPFLRALIEIYRNGHTSETGMIQQAEAAIKLIRNEELKSHTCIHYENELHQRYFNYLPHSLEQAHERLTRFLGYRPELQAALCAELLLREAMADDTCYLADHLTGIDIQAITIVKYREVLIANGEEAANNSPLIALDLRIEHQPEFSKEVLK